MSNAALEVGADGKYSQRTTIVGSLANVEVDETGALKTLVTGLEVTSVTATNIESTDIGKKTTAVTLQSNATATGNGTAFTPTVPKTLTFEISGTSTSRTVVFEIAGPSGTFVAHPGYKQGDTTYTPATSTTGGTTTSPESWEVDIPANYSFRARISAVTGGDIDISGWAVAQ